MDMINGWKYLAKTIFISACDTGLHNERRIGMFEKFGEFDSCEEINKAAAGFKEEGDIDSLKAMCTENGIEEDDVADFIAGETDYVCNCLTAAIGKLQIEEKALNLPESILISDWVDYIRMECLDNNLIAAAVRRKGNSLVGCIGQIMKEAFKNQWEVPKEIKVAAAIRASNVTFGIPSEARCRDIINAYYGG